MRIAIQLCRASRGAKQTTLGKALAISVAAVLLAAGPVLAEHTRWWRQSSFEDFDKGTAKESLCAVMASFSSRRTSQNLPTPISRTCWLCAPIRREISMRRAVRMRKSAAGRERQGDDRF